jgi:hypothetical protein
MKKFVNHLSTNVNQLFTLVDQCFQGLQEKFVMVDNFLVNMNFLAYIYN